MLHRPVQIPLAESGIFVEYVAVIRHCALLSDFVVAAVEEHFYLIWPTATRRMTPTKLLWTLGAILVLPFLRLKDRWPGQLKESKTEEVRNTAEATD